MYLEEVSDVLSIVQAGKSRVYTRYLQLCKRLEDIGKNINFTVLFLLLCLMNLCFRISELPNLLPITEVCETLLHLPNGTLLMNRLVANVADSFHEGICILIMFVTTFYRNT